MAHTNRLRRLREASEIDKRELAKGFGVHERTIYRWETGETPIPERHWARLAEIFGVSVAYLLGLTNGNDGGHGHELKAA